MPHKSVLDTGGGHLSWFIEEKALVNRRISNKELRMLKYKPKAICSFLTFDIRHSLFCGSIFPSIQFSLHQFAPPVSSNRLMSKDKPPGEGRHTANSMIVAQNVGEVSLRPIKSAFCLHPSRRGDGGEVKVNLQDQRIALFGRQSNAAGYSGGMRPKRRNKAMIKTAAQTR
jgi:hypothetical protein